MSAFAVAAFHEPRLAHGAAAVDAVVWIRAAGLAASGTEVALRLWTPAGAHLEALREVAPSSADLMARATRLDARTQRFDAGRWTDGVYEYELTVALPVRAAGDELLAARVGVLADGQLAGGALIAVTWTDEAPDETPAGEPEDVPTGPSLEPRHTSAGEPGAVGSCPGCGEAPDDGDRFCESCGRELAPG